MECDTYVHMYGGLDDSGAGVGTCCYRNRCDLLLGLLMRVRVSGDMFRIGGAGGAKGVV